MEPARDPEPRATPASAGRRSAWTAAAPRRSCPNTRLVFRPNAGRQSEGREGPRPDAPAVAPTAGWIWTRNMEHGGPTSTPGLRSLWGRGHVVGGAEASGQVIPV